MLAKTHLAVGIFTMLFFISHINYKIIFIPVMILASLLPDIDTGFSTLGKKRYFRLVQFFTKHRGILHSFTFCIVASVLLAFYIPVLAFPFFLGYSIHLLIDAWTIEGIRPFWPIDREVKGHVKVGGHVEQTIFLVFIIIDVVFALFLISTM